MEIVALRPEHLEEAARLFAASYRRERRHLPILPTRHEDERGVLPMLSGLLDRAPGVAALSGGRLVGYLIGLEIPDFKGVQRGAYSPIWAHAAVGEERPEVYRRMYERLARTWVDGGILTHAVTLYASDAAVQDVWFRDCFGLSVVDAIRALDPVAVSACSEVEVRQATLADVDLILPLVRGLERHLADSPIFLPLSGEVDRSEHESWLAEPAHALWLALAGGEPVAYLRCQPPEHDVAYVVSDPATTAITGAYTRPDWRGRGVSTLLLDRLLDWARQSGYERCSVDFESQNAPGSRFWLRHFQPICHSLIRRVDERVVQVETSGQRIRGAD